MKPNPKKNKKQKQLEKGSYKLEGQRAGLIMKEEKKRAFDVLLVKTTILFIYLFLMSNIYDRDC